MINLIKYQSIFDDLRDDSIDEYDCDGEGHHHHCHHHQNHLHKEI